jgi:hypothetical protein
VIPKDGVCNYLGPVCGVVGSAGSSAASLVLNAIGGAFVSAAQQVTDIALSALDATTQIDLTATWFTNNLGVIAAVTLPAVVGLFCLQVIGSVLRREPGGLGRALVGLAKAMLGAAMAIAVTQLAIVATDQICAVIAASAGTSVKGAAQRFLKLTWLAGPTAGPVLQMLLGLAIIIGSMLLWAVLLFRKASVLLVAVFAPVAFAGAVWDQTRGWSRRWIEVMASLVLCKIVIVVVFVLGVSAFANNGTIQTSTGATPQPAATSLSDLLVGLMLLSIAVFAPWMTWRFVHWSGMEAGQLHGAMASTPVPAAARTTASQGKFMAQSAATSALLGGARGGSAMTAKRAGAASTGSGLRGAPPSPGAAATRVLDRPSSPAQSGPSA